METTEIKNIIAYSYGDFRNTDSIFRDNLKNIDRVLRENEIKIDLESFLLDEISFNDVINIVIIFNGLITSLTDDFFNFIYDEPEYKNKEQLPEKWISIYVDIDNILRWTEDRFGYKIIRFGNEWFIYYKEHWIDIEDRVADGTDKE